MGYFKNKMRKFVNWATSDDYANQPYPNGIASLQNSKKANTVGIGSNSNNIEGQHNGMNFTVYSATGGKVIQIRTYDHLTDRSRSVLYIVTDKEDLGHELGQILTIESLSR